MKKILFILAAALLLSTSITAQRSGGAIKLGLFDPGATSSGFILGYQGTRYIDERLDLGWSIDWFYKSYTDQTLVDNFEDQFGFGGETYELAAETNIHNFPLMFNLVGYFPVEKKATVFVNGAIGADLLLTFYKDFNNENEDDFKAALDFSWQLSAGVMYELGSKSDIFAEVGYHNSEPSWTYKATNPNTGKESTFERRFDMSGILLRAGVKFYY